MNSLMKINHINAAVERKQLTRVKVLFSQFMFMISSFALITSQPSKEQQLNIDNHVLISFMLCDERLSSQFSME